jgi:hypothetical protein
MSPPGLRWHHAGTLDPTCNRLRPIARRNHLREAGFTDREVASMIEKKAVGVSD